MVTNKINYGIINSGDHCTNIMYDISDSQLEKELIQLKNEGVQTEVITEALNLIYSKKQSKLKDCLKKLSLETLYIIKKLSLTALEAYIQKYLI